MSERPIATPNTAYREIGDLLDFSTGGADDFAKAFSEVSHWRQIIVSFIEQPNTAFERRMHMRTARSDKFS